jgi:hypothetical protein
MGTLNGIYDGSIVNGYLEMEVSADGTRRVIEQWSERVHPDRMGTGYRKPDSWKPRPKSPADERERQGAARGREKGVETNKESGKVTAARITDFIVQANADSSDRCLAAKIAKALTMKQSTVARHLRAINKQK